jgi:hypothetical protein
MLNDFLIFFNKPSSASGSNAGPYLNFLQPIALLQFKNAPPPQPPRDWWLWQLSGRWIEL